MVVELSCRMDVCRFVGKWDAARMVSLIIERAQRKWGYTDTVVTRL